MRFLIDNALAPRLARELCKHGFDAIHVRDIGLQEADDSVIFDHASDENRIVVSADTDFGTLLALRATHKPSIVLVRTTRKSTDFVLPLLLTQLNRFSDELSDGAIVVIEDHRVRIRRLPIQRLNE